MCTEKRALLSILLLFIINVIIVIILIIGAFVYTISYLRLRCIPLIHRVHGRKTARCLTSRAAANAQIANTLHGSIASLALPPLLGFRNPKIFTCKILPRGKCFSPHCRGERDEEEEMTTTTKRRDSTKGMLAILCLVLLHCSFVSALFDDDAREEDEGSSSHSPRGNERGAAWNGCAGSGE